MDRRPLDENVLEKQTRFATYKDYFESAARFLSADRFSRVRKAVADIVGKNENSIKISRIDIFLVKHGAFYHPSRVRVQTHQGVFSFVLNIAVSENGKQIIEREYQALLHLNEALPIKGVPQVFAMGRAAGESGRDFCMFLGQWFDGFHEFHPTTDPKNDLKSEKQRIMVWDGNKTPLYLSEQQEAALYQNCAMILAAYYNPVTFQQIFPWHHGAGDFIVRPEKNSVSVKLITVRGYEAAMAGKSTPTEKDIIEALMIFLIQVSFKMRLDRFDGVGDIAWAKDALVKPAMDGFFQGLDIAATATGFPQGFSDHFRSLLSGVEPDHWLDLARHIVTPLITSNPDEIRVIQKYLKAHVHTLSSLL